MAGPGSLRGQRRLGGPPSHPELLDWLTARFIAEGWRLKSLHRLVLLSATYRQSTSHADFDEYTQIDPANQLYWRQSTMRLTAEQIRDSLLAVTGMLKDYSGGPGQLALAGINSALAGTPRTHHRPTAKRVIFLFMEGGPSHLDLFDPKPLLNQLAGQRLPESFGEVITAMGEMKSPLLSCKRHLSQSNRQPICQCNCISAIGRVH